MSSSADIHKALINEVHLRLFEESLPRILKCLDQLNNDQIWWRPNPSSNSIGNLVLHLCGNVTQWICTGLGGLPYERHRQAEFDQRDPIPKQELKTMLVFTMELAKPVIAELPVEELLRIRDVQTFRESGLSILVHVTEHFSYHTGQISYITKMLTDRSLGFYDGIPLE